MKPFKLSGIYNYELRITNYELILVDVHSAENLYHFPAERIVYFKPALGRKLVSIGVEKIILQENFLYHHFCVEDIGLINIYINGVIAFESVLVDIVLNGSYVMVYEQLLAVFVAGETADAVVNGDNIRVEASYKIVKGFERRCLSAGGNVYIHAESGNFIVRVEFGIGMHREMAFVQMSGNTLLGDTAHLAHIAGGVNIFYILVRNQYGHRRALRVIVLLGNIQHVRADHFRNVAEDLRQTVGIVLFVNVFDIIRLFPRAFCIANIVNVKAESLGKIIEAEKLELVVQPYPHVPFVLKYPYIE